MTTKIVVAAYDCLSPLGMNIEITWQQVTSNRSGITQITRYDPATQTLHGLSAVTYGAQIPQSYCELAGSPNKFTRSPEPVFHCIAQVCRKTLKSINFDIKEHDPQRIALIGGTALTSHVSHFELQKTGRPFVNFMLNQCQNVPLALVGVDTGIRGPCFSINSACASSGHALFVACQLIKADLIDSALVIAYEFPLVPPCVAGFEWINALYKSDRPGDRAHRDPAVASRPFSQDRRGFVLGEGVAAVFITRAELAKSMSWPIKAIIRGAHLNSDGDHLTRISVANVAHCMELALRSAGCTTDDIGCISAHATSTPSGDEAELNALSQVFGKRLNRIPLMANKSQLGHSLGASSLLQFILGIQAIAYGVVLPTLNHLPDQALPEAWIPTVCSSYQHELLLLNSFGFGGTNVSLIISGN